MLAPDLDREFLAELLDGDREFGHELFQAFEDASTDWIRSARTACETGDQATATRAFHTLKGSSASVGLLDLRQLALTCETLAKEGDLESCLGQLDRLEASVVKGRALLSDFLKGLSG